MVYLKVLYRSGSLTLKKVDNKYSLKFAGVTSADGWETERVNKEEMIAFLHSLTDFKIPKQMFIVMELQDD